MIFRTRYLLTGYNPPRGVCPVIFPSKGACDRLSPSVVSPEEDAAVSSGADGRKRLLGIGQGSFSRVLHVSARRFCLLLPYMEMLCHLHRQTRVAGNVFMRRTHLVDRRNKTYRYIVRKNVYFYGSFVGFSMHANLNGSSWNVSCPYIGIVVGRDAQIRIVREYFNELRDLHSWEIAECVSIWRMLRPRLGLK